MGTRPSISRYGARKTRLARRDVPISKILAAKAGMAGMSLAMAANGCFPVAAALRGGRAGVELASDRPKSGRSHVMTGATTLNSLCPGWMCRRCLRTPVDHVSGPPIRPRHPRLQAMQASKTWMAGSSPARTRGTRPMVWSHSLTAPNGMALGRGGAATAQQCPRMTTEQRCRIRLQL